MALLGPIPARRVRGGESPAGRCWLLAVVVTVAWLVGLPVGVAQDAPLPEKQVKAAFLVNFPKYVEWPADAFADTNSPIVLAVLGESELNEDLQKMIQGRTVAGRTIHFKVVSEVSSASGCHILFIPDAERRRMTTVLERVKRSSVLTVGESDEFLARGGGINLARRDQKVRLEVNLAATKQARLKISSKLLAVADAVKGR